MSPTTDTQVCSKCPENGEQPLVNFHRRGNRYQKICKACRNLDARETYQERGKTPLTRPIVTINSDNFPALVKRIEPLQSKLVAKAGSFAHDALDADDIYSAMIDAILTTCKPEDTDAYILQKAQWAGQAYLARNLTYNHYVQELELDEEKTESAGFKVVEAARVTEDELVVMETYQYLHKVIESLPKENRNIVVMISIGMNQREIAEKLEVSEQTISERMKTIRATLTATFLNDGQIELSF